MTKILRFPSVIEKTGLSRSTIYLKISQGIFPKPFSLGPNSIGWLEKDVDDWINSRAITNFGAKVTSGIKERGRAVAKTSEGSAGEKRIWAA